MENVKGENRLLPAIYSGRSLFDLKRVICLLSVTDFSQDTVDRTGQRYTECIRYIRRFQTADAASELLCFQLVVVGNFHLVQFVRTVEGAKTVGQSTGGVECKIFRDDTAFRSVDLEAVQRLFFSVSSTIPQSK